MQKEAFGKLLVILRKKNGLSQKELAERLSVSTSAVSKWENGKNLPDMMMLSRIADILQVSCDELHNPEKTLEKLDNPEFQKRNVEEGDKENTDNTGENEESEPEPQKKNYGRIVRMSFLIGILAIAAGMFLIYMAGHRKPAFQQIGTRYIDDPLWGRVYEIAYVVDGCEFPYKSRVMGTSEPLKPLKAPYMARNPVKWGFFRLKGQEIPLKI